MAILGTLSNLNPNLFTPLPTCTPSPSRPRKPPIPPPKYPPPVKSPKQPPKPQPHPALKTPHRRSAYYKPINGDVISSDGGRSVILGESGVSYLLPGAPFEFQFSYSETPKVKPVAVREPGFLPFAPPTMARPWTGKAPMKNKARKERKIRLFESLEPNVGGGGGRRMEMRREYRLGDFRGEVATRRKVIGKPLTRAEITELVKPYISGNRQVNLGRDGLTHNMLELVHTHWKRRPVCKVRCLGVPTVDMDNVCRCLEEKTGGKIIHRVGGIVYLFRGRNYDPRTRPRYPVMLWKPATPVYPKLIQEAPEGLTKAEADELREKGKNLLPICKLAKNGVYITLVKDVRNAFESSILVKIDCRGLDPSDYKRIGAKLKELVPCVLLSFDNEQILMWRGKDWKSMYPDATPGPADGIAMQNSSESQTADDGKSERKTLISSPKMMSLWKRAIETNKARLLEEIALAPDDLLEIVEEFDGLSQATEHSYPAQIFTKNDDATTSWAEYGNIRGEDHSKGEYYSDDNDYDNEYYVSGSHDEIGSSVPRGSLPVDFIATQSSEQ